MSYSTTPSTGTTDTGGNSFTLSEKRVNTAQYITNEESDLEYWGENFSFEGYSQTAEEQSAVEILSITNVHRGDYEDVPDIEALATEDTIKMYNLKSIKETLHRCIITIVLRDSKKSVVAAASFADFPIVPSIPSDEWVSWVKRIYGLRDICSYNTLWVHMFVYDLAYEDQFLKPMIRYIFETFIKLQYIIFVVPAGFSKYITWLEKVSTTILPTDYLNPNRVQTLRILIRQDFVLNYKIRRAVEEDNDDLVPLIDAYSARFRQLYGDYYIAEIITRHPDAGRHLIVAEYKGLAVSVLCLNDNVNYDQLNKSFNLDIFNNLLKPDTLEEVPSVQSSSYTIYSESLLDRLSSISPGSQSNTDTMGNTSNSSSAERISDSLPSIFQSSISSEKYEFRSRTTMSSSITDSDLSMEEEEEEFFFEEDQLKTIEKEEENAFAIEIAAALPEHQFSLYLLLEAAFECFPNKEYCILTVPSNQPFIDFLKFFTRVTPRRQSLHPHELYIFHRYGTFEVSAKQATLDDVDQILKFASYLKKPKGLYETFLNSQRDPDCKLKTFLLNLEKKDTEMKTIGVVMVNDLDNLPLLKRKYAIRVMTDLTLDRIEEIGVIEYFCMSPLFRMRLKLCVREIHRLSGFNTLFYAINRCDGTNRRTRPLPSNFCQLNLVPPRKMMNEVETPEEPFALYLTTIRLSTNSIIEVNTRIVVVGASYTAVAFLEALLLKVNLHPKAIFNNVTLVSSQGICFNKRSHSLKNMMQVKSSCNDFDYMEKINLRAYVNVVTGNITAINRQEKTITVERSHTMPYDLLFIMSGIQYGGVSFQKDFIKNKHSSVPENIFTINSENDAGAALVKLKMLCAAHKKSKYTIVVYGYNLESYCCVATLLEFGVPANYIWLVEEEKALNHDFLFQDADVYQAVMETIDELGVNHLEGYQIINWAEIPDGRIRLFLESKLRLLELETLAVFLYNEKSINYQTYYALIQSGLVYDGKLVIGPDCRTNDPYIYAAGRVTKYSRRFYADHLLHKYFNSEEIGAELGSRIRKQLLPFEEDVNKDKYTKECFAENNVVPIYEKPLIQYCQLPGGMYYLHVSKPGVVVPLETAMADDDYGTVLCTGRCRKLQQQGYFRIHLNPGNVVETITCLSLDKFDYKKLTLLWGKHESLLNKMLKRFELTYITDLFEYFERPWCSALFHDDFPFLEAEVTKLLTCQLSDEGLTLLEELLIDYKANGYKPMSSDELELIMSKFEKTNYEQKVESKLLNLILENIITLPMYAHPVIVSYLLAAYEESPLFKEM